MNVIRSKFNKSGHLKYISHLDLMRLMNRALRRADIPVVYTQGFNPQPRISFATALSLGVESEGEYVDIELSEHIPEQQFIESLNDKLPDGIKIIKVSYVNDKKSIMSLIRWSQYIIELKFDENMNKESLQDIIDKVLSQESIMYTKTSKKKGKKIRREVEIRNLIKSIEILMFNNNTAVVKSTLRTGSDGNLKPEALVDVFERYGDLKINREDVKIQRIELFIENDGKAILPIA